MDWKQSLGMSGGVLAAVTLVAGAAVGLGFIPSATEVGRLAAAVEKVSESQEGRGLRVASVEKDNAVQAQQIANIESTVKRIETTQATQFDKMMTKLDKIDRRRR